MSSAFPGGIPSILNSTRGTVLLGHGCLFEVHAVELYGGSASSGDAEDGKVDLDPERAPVVSI